MASRTDHWPSGVGSTGAAPFRWESLGTPPCCRVRGNDVNDSAKLYNRALACVGHAYPSQCADFTDGEQVTPTEAGSRGSGESGQSPWPCRLWNDRQGDQPLSICVHIPGPIASSRL